ncbi:MAG: efflux transporter outer membrane subunit [Steroidobacteraceae bacterium]
MKPVTRGAGGAAGRRAVARGRLAVAAGSLAVLLAGCAVGPNFAPPKPDVPSTWSRTALGGARGGASAAESGTSRAGGASAIDTSTPTIAEWWSSFKDPTLTSLIERSLGANLDLREAVVRIEEARAQRQQTAAGLWPTLAANASFTRQRFSLNTPNGAVFGIAGSGGIAGLPSGVTISNPFDQYQLGLSASWEIDLFGRVRRSVEAANADLQSAVESARGVRISLASDVSEAYIDLRGAQRKRSIVEQSLATQRDLYELTRERWNAGLTTDLDVENASSEVSATRAQLPPLDREITQDVNQLSRLINREPDALRAELEQARPVPPVPPRVPIGLPAELARRRPDIREAEASLHAATARVGVAVADLFPRLTLSAAGGYQSEGLSRLIETASRFASFGPTLELPIFEAGARRAVIRLQTAREKEAAIDYARVVLGALNEVENALAAYASEQDSRVSLAAASQSSENALTLARQRYASGLASFIDVLDAERTLEQNQLSLAQSTTAESTDLVELYRALGGGWSGP